MIPDLIQLYTIKSSKIDFIQVFTCPIYGKDYYKIHFTNGRVKLLKES